MPTRRSHYDFLEVSPTASQEQIRAAYLALMKQYHPDRAHPDERQERSEFVAVVNRSYDVLKEPARRARYDAMLARRMLRGSRPRGHRALLAGTTVRTRQRGWDRTSVAAAILGCGIAIVSIAALSLPSGFLISGNSTDAGAAAPRAAEPLSVLAVQRDVRLAMQVTPTAAVRESQSCFGQARRESNQALLQACIVFDDAYLDWTQLNPDERGQSLYFNEALVHLRQRNAAAALGSADDAALDDLHRIALDALMVEIRSRLDVRETSPSGTSAAAL